MSKEDDNNPWEEANIPGRYDISLQKLFELIKPHIFDGHQSNAQKLRKLIPEAKGQDFAVIVEPVVSRSGNGKIMGINTDQYKALESAFSLKLAGMLRPKTPFYATVEGKTNEDQPVDPFEVRLQHIESRGRTHNQVAITKEVASLIDPACGLIITEIYQDLRDVNLGFD